ncbi:MAG: hypothetical protein ACOY5Y_07180 [Pseudomonadota bacterium]
MRPFTDVLRDMRKGRVVDAIGDELAEVVKAVLDTNKAGELTLKFKVKPQGKGDNAVIISADIKSKRPQGDLPDALFFADLDGDLLRDDPTQQRMFADAARAAGERIDPDTGEVLAN